MKKSIVPQILTIDLEEFYHANYPNYNYQTVAVIQRLPQLVPEILNVLEQYGHTATFFVLGEIAENYPELIKMIYEHGHEVASHSYTHRLLSKLPIEEAKSDIERGVTILNKILDYDSVIGFRAPNFAMGKNKEKLLSYIVDIGIRYDSSLLPVKTYYGDAVSTVKFPYIIHPNGNQKKLYEIPPTVSSIFPLRFPISGGYMRALPLWFIKKAMNNSLKIGHPAVIYVHPRDFDKNSPGLSSSFPNKLIHNAGASIGRAHLLSLLASYKFTSIANYLEVLNGSTKKEKK